MAFDWKLVLYSYLLPLMFKMYQMYFVNTESDVSQKFNRAIHCGFNSNAPLTLLHFYFKFFKC